MEAPVIAAIISSSVAIIAPITTYIVTKKFENRNIQKLNRGRLAIVGTWVGSFTQFIDGTQEDITINVTLTAKGKVIEGDGEYYRKKPNKSLFIKLKFTGGFINDDFIKLDYINTDKSTIHFGCCISQLKPDGRTLIGTFVGYGFNTQSILSGQLILTKTS